MELFVKKYYWMIILELQKKMTFSNYFLFTIFSIVSPCTKIVNRTTAYVSISIRDLTSPILSGKVKGKGYT